MNMHGRCTPQLLLVLTCIVSANMYTRCSVVTLFVTARRVESCVSAALREEVDQRVERVPVPTQPPHAYFGRQKERSGRRGPALSFFVCWTALRKMGIGVKVVSQ
ncbi:hypothetical protein B0H19DRAFT_1120725 [Mycena capillaripes]|nr:hypothetical protein B0H19DRAFT_1120725 [Mycena capillaripes]